jgi:hypothetical protein
VEAESFKGNMLDGERIEHGAIKVLSVNVNKTFTKGLKFYEEETGTDEVKIARCRTACYTDVTCSVWLYNQKGCYVEMLPDNEKGETTEDGPLATSIVAGETIEHYCPLYTPPTGPAPEDGPPWGYIGAGAGLGALAVGGAVYALKKKPKVKATRAVKVTPATRDVPEPVLPPKKKKPVKYILIG